MILFGPAPGIGFALGAALSLDLLEGVGMAPEDPQDISRVGSAFSACILAIVLKASRSSIESKKE